MCALVTAGSLTYLDNHSVTKTSAKTLSEIEDEKAANDSKISALEKEIESLEGDIAAEKEYQAAIQEKIDL
jgi:hypothetical protein